MKRWFSRFKAFRLPHLPLRGSEAQLRAMLAAMNDIVLVVDAEGRYLQVAPTNTAQLYRPPEELLGKTFYDFFSRQQADEFLTAVREALTSQRTVMLEYPMTIASRDMWFEAKISSLRTEAVVWTAHDITLQKQRERELATISNANARLLEIEREQRAVAEALHDTLVALSGTLNLDEVLDLVLRNIDRVIPNDAAGVIMLDRKVGRIVRWRGRGEPGLEHAVYGLEFPLERTTHLWQIVQTGRALIIPDMLADTDRITHPATAWIRAYCGAPLRAGGQVIGVVEAHHATPAFYTPDHLEQLLALADQVSIALEKVQRLEAEREQQAVAEALYDTTFALNSTLNLDEVLDRILKNAGRIVPNDAANIAVIEAGVVYSIRWLGYINPNESQKIQDIRWKLDEVPNLRQIVESHQPQLIADTYQTPDWIIAPATSWIRSYVAAPIETKGRVLGVLELSSSMPHFFTDTHVSRLHVFATQAAIALENARLFDQMQQRVQELSTLYDSSVAISRSLDRTAILHTILQQLAEAVAATSTYVVWIDWEHLRGTVIAEYFTPRASELERVSDLHESFVLSESPHLLEAIQLGRPFFETINQPNADPFTVADLKRFGGKSNLRLPVTISGQVRGYFIIWDSQSERQWSEAEIRLCQTLANQAGVAIFNAQLFEDAQRRAVEQAALFAATRAVSSSLDFNVVLQRLAEQMAWVIDVTSVYIADWNPHTATTTALVEYVGPEASPEERVSDLGQTHALDEVLGGPYDWLMRGGATTLHVDDAASPAQVRQHLRQYGGQSALLVALAARGTVFGYAALWESRRRREFTLAEISLCQSIAQQAAIAFENARLFEAERQQLQLAQTLQAVGALLTSAMSLVEVFEQLFDLLGRVVRYDSVSIHQVDETGIRLGAGRGFRNLAQVQQDVATLSKDTVEERWGDPLQRLLVIPDTHHDQRWITIPESEHIHSWIGAALRVKGRLLGILNVDSATVNEYNESIGETVAAFANQAAIAIENAQLHDADRHHADELEQRVQLRTAELERERKRTAAILYAAGEGIVTTDTEGHIEYMNPAMERLTGYSLVEALGQRPSLWRNPHTPTEFYAHLWDTIKRGEIWRGELINRRRDGSLFDAALTIGPLQDIDGRIIGYVGVQRDITQQKELNRLKDEFVSNVSHELRTPIANVKLYISLLTRGKPEKYEEYLQTLRREATRLEKLIEDLLDLSRLDLGATQLVLRPIDLNRLAAQLIADRMALAAQRQLVIDYRSDSDVLVVQADEAKLVQIMSNLLTNAINYTPPRGQITVTTAMQQDQEERWVTFTVQDTGPGISQQDLSHLFERFYRGEAGRKSGAPGTGLGLAISRQVVSLMGGHITVESKPGQGATFTVWCKSMG